MRQHIGVRFFRQLPLSSLKTYQQTMKLNIHSLTVVSSICFFPSSSVNAWSPVQTKRWSSSLHASVAPEVPKTTEIVAKGSIVSYFHGGLAAVQLRDDLMTQSVDATSPLFDTLAPPSSIIAQRTNNNGDDLIGRTVTFGNGATGMVVAQRPPILFVYSSDLGNQAPDGPVAVSLERKKVTVTDDMGIVDCFGLPTVSLVPGVERAIFSPIPQVADIALINSPMLTGSTMYDALSPIGKGQNMLVIGADHNDLRNMAQDFLATQVKRPNTKCVYACTHDKENLLAQLKENGLLDNVIVVAPRDGYETKDAVAQAAEATAIAACACAIAETFAHNEGIDALVIVDNIDPLKVLWDATTRVLVDVFGITSVVKDDRDGGASSEMRGFFSALIQRAGCFKAKKGGGSVTLTMLTHIPSNDDGQDTVFEQSQFANYGANLKARIDLLVGKKIPLTAATLRKINIPLPSVSEGKRRLVLQHVDDLMSMSDGQIWLDERLKAVGQRPAMDPQRSVTRIGIGADTESRADAPAIRRIVEGLRLDLSQAANMEGAEVTDATIKQKRKCDSWLLAMHQEPGEGGRDLAESCIALLAASSGALDATIDTGALAGTDEGKRIMKELLNHVTSTTPAAVKSIEESEDITPEVKAEVLSAIRSFFA